MSKRVFLALAAMAMIVTSTAMAQEAQGPPQPGPEHKRLAYFVGKWKHEADIQPGAFGPGGKYTATETCEWYAGNMSVVCNTDGSASFGTVKALAVMGWNSGEKTYAYFETNSFGEVIYARGSVEADTWTWSSEQKMGDKVVRARFTAKEVSPDSTSYKFEMGPPDAMKLVMEGKGTRVK